VEDVATPIVAEVGKFTKMAVVKVRRGVKTTQIVLAVSNVSRAFARVPLRPHATVVVEAAINARELFINIATALAGVKTLPKIISVKLHPPAWPHRLLRVICAPEWPIAAVPATEKEALIAQLAAKPAARLSSVIPFGIVATRMVIVTRGQAKPVSLVPAPP